MCEFLVRLIAEIVFYLVGAQSVSFYTALVSPMHQRSNTIISSWTYLFLSPMVFI